MQNMFDKSNIDLTVSHWDIIVSLFREHKVKQERDLYWPLESALLPYYYYCGGFIAGTLGK